MYYLISIKSYSFVSWYGFNNTQVQGGRVVKEKNHLKCSICLARGCTNQICKIMISMTELWYKCSPIRTRNGNLSPHSGVADFLGKAICLNLYRILSWTLTPPTYGKVDTEDPGKINCSWLRGWKNGWGQQTQINIPDQNPIKWTPPYYV